LNIGAFTAEDSINSAAFGGGKFIAGAGVGSPVVAISANGTAWEKVEIPAATFDSYVGKIAWLNDSFIITRGSNVPYGIYSPDGGSWIKTEIGFGTKGHCYANDGITPGIFIVAGQHGQAAWSNSIGGPWNKLEMEDTTFDNGNQSQLYINAVVYGNGVFVMGGGRGHTAVSADGKIWEGIAANTQSEAIFDAPDGFIDCMAFGNGRFIALGGMDGYDAKSASSADGIHWTQGGDPFLKAGNGSPCIAFGGAYFLAADSDGNASFTSDGDVWTALETTTFNGRPIKGITYGNNKFIMVGGEGKAAEVIIQ
jgi:hypothetical protein